MMGRTSEIKSVDQDTKIRSYQDDFVAKARLNLNDLLQRRQEEKQSDKKTSLLIFSGATAAALVVFVILSL